MTCPTPEEIAEERIDRVLTQYRESPKLLFMLRTYLARVAEAALQICDLPDKFDIETARGDQLTILGKRMGWPRCHCVCDVEPVFGFDCPDGINVHPITGFGGTLPTTPFGFCEGTEGFCATVPTNWDGCPIPDLTNAAVDSNWINCSSGLSELCLSDDEIYRKFLKVRRFQYMRQYDLGSLEECLKIFFGPQAQVLYAGQGRIVCAPGRDLTDSELFLLQLYPRVLPVALGIQLRFHFGETRVFGFGDGWGGFCELDYEKTYSVPEYQEVQSIFGFCDGYGGFCEGFVDNNSILLSDPQTGLITEDGRFILAGKLPSGAIWLCREGSPWMCEVDLKPYTC